MTGRRLLVPVIALLLAGCQQGETTGSGASSANIPDPDATEPYAGIGLDEVLRFSGTEPFWGGNVTGTTLTYTTPEKPPSTIAVERFAGRGGISFSGKLDQAELEMTVTQLACSDGMSDRTYPFTVMLKIGADTRSGCGWSDRHPFEGPKRP